MKMWRDRPALVSALLRGTATALAFRGLLPAILVVLQAARMALPALLVAPPVAALDAAIEPYDPPETCALCDGSLRVPVIKLTPAWLDSLAHARAQANAAQIARIDSLFAAGYYGSKKTHEARRAAHLVARLTLVNGYPDLVRLARDSTCVYEADEATLREVNTRYSDFLLFATARLQRVRLGLGQACLHYNVATPGEGETIHGGKHLRWRIRDAQVGGKTRRLLSLDLPTATDDVVEVLLAPHYTFRVDYKRVSGPPAPYDFFLVHDIEGGWLCKSGTHRPTAYMYWVNSSGPDLTPVDLSSNMMRRHEDRSEFEVAGASGGSPIENEQRPIIDLPETPLVGLRVYIPGLRLRLPSFLPDINFDDLREVEPPMPVLTMEFLKQKSQPAWLGSADHLGFKDWKGYGALPPGVRERFPDL